MQLRSQKENLKLNDEVVKLAKIFALKYYDEKEIEWGIVPNSEDVDLEGVDFIGNAQWKKEIECDPDNEKLSDIFFENFLPESTCMLH